MGERHGRHSRRKSAAADGPAEDAAARRASVGAALDRAEAGAPAQPHGTDSRILEGYLKKSEYKAPVTCGCVPMRDRRFKDKYVVLDVRAGAMLYARNRHHVKTVPKTIDFRHIKSVALLEGNEGRRFRVTLKARAYQLHNGREHFTWMAINHTTALRWVAALQECAFLRCNVYEVSPSGGFPELSIGVPPLTAVCFSGGGARAHVATMGQLRALHILGVLNDKDINYISSVSGSSWATSIFTFYRHGAKDDDDLLGPHSHIKDLNMQQLARDPPPLGKVATVEMWKLAESLFWQTAMNEWWETTVGQTYLEPFGLNDDLPFAHPSLRHTITSNNAMLSAFHIARRGRPFWIANAAVLGPSGSRTEDAVPVQFTPMYSGTPFLHKLAPHGHKAKTRPSLAISIGGGMIDSYAFGSEEPDAAPSLIDGVKAAAQAATDMVKEMFKFMENMVVDDELASDNLRGDKRHSHPRRRSSGAHHHRKNSGHGGPHHSVLDYATQVRVPFPERPLTLRHAIGISSHAPAIAFKKYALTARLNPKSLYWSPVSTVAAAEAVPDSVDLAVAAGMAADEAKRSRAVSTSSAAGSTSGPAREMDFADGGTLDNIGLLAMLQRRVERIIVCVNSEVPVPMQPISRKRAQFRGTSARFRSTRGARTSAGLHTNAGLHTSARHRSSTTGSGLARPSSTSLGHFDVDEDSGFIFDEEDIEPPSEAQPFLPTYRDWPQSSILPLFGIKVHGGGEMGTFDHNKVFETEQIVSLLEQLQNCKLNGEPCVAVDTYTTLENKWWNIPAGHEVTIMWYYLDKTRSFELQLPRETLHEIDAGSKGHFPRFPTYRTFGTRHGKWIDPSLSNEQVNLLSALTEWSLLQNGSLIKDFLRTKSKQRREELDEMMEDLKDKGFA